jgi:hypothetical protein
MNLTIPPKMYAEVVDGVITRKVWLPADAVVPPNLVDITDVQWLDEGSAFSEADRQAIKDAHEAAKIERGADAKLSDKFNRMLFAVHLDLENRVRALEGQPATTATQYKAHLIALWKAL